MAQRIFYDPRNPRMLSDRELATLTPGECVEAREQLEQNIVSLLQETDENFVKCIRAVTDKIIPAIERHGRNSKEIWDSVKVFKTFFETAANVKLSDPLGDQDDFVVPRAEAQTVDDDENEQESTIGADSPLSQGPSYHGTVLAPGTGMADDSIDEPHSAFIRATPAANQNSLLRQLRTAQGDQSGQDAGKEPSWSNDISPFEALQRELGHVGGSGGNDASGSVRLRANPALLNSPDVEIPDFHTLRLNVRDTDDESMGPSSVSQESRRMDKGNDKEVEDGDGDGDGLSLLPDLPLPSRGSRSVVSNTASDAVPSLSGPPKLPPKSPAHPMLLHQVLRKNLAGGVPAPEGAPKASTPISSRVLPSKLYGKSSALPPDVPKGWNGLADLSKTSLSSFTSPNKSRKATSADNSKARPPAPVPLDSPPSFHFGANLTATPAKEAARKVARDVYDATAPAGLLQGRFAANVDSPDVSPPSVMKNWATRGYDSMGGEGARKGFEEESYEDEGDDSVDFKKPVQPTSEDVPGPRYAHSDEEDDDGVGHHPDARTSIGSPLRADDPDFAEGEGDEEEYEAEEEVEQSWDLDDLQGDGDEAGLSFGDEDEVHPPPRGQAEDTLFGAAGQRRSEGGERGAFHLRGLIGPEEMDTLHGGKLLESEPVASPLAGRDPREWRG